MKHYFFHINDVPFSELNEVGIDKESFLNLPPYYLDNIMTGRLSPVFLLDFRQTIGKKMLAKISLIKEKSNTTIQYHFVYKDFENILNIPNRKLLKLLSGLVIVHTCDKKRIYIELDTDTNTIMTTPYKDINYPSYLSEDEIKAIESEKCLSIERDNALFTIGLSLIEKNGYQLTRGSKSDWLEEKNKNKFLTGENITFLQYNHTTKDWNLTNL